MTRGAVFLAVALLTGSLAVGAAPSRHFPHTEPDHPGNIFVTGEDVFVKTPASDSRSWTLVDYEKRTIAHGSTAGGIRLGKLPAGYYEVTLAGEGSPGTFSLGVLEALRAPTPLTSPVCIDVAAAWLVPADKMKATANLSALAGVNWVRDRLNWEELEPARGHFAESNKYDLSVAVQARAGLQVLEVSHRSPKWATATPERFPDDLRDAYDYHKALAARWQGKVGAFEPWNEADITMFGGHTGSEMASLQKAAFLGLKAGNPKVIASLNVFALHRKSTLSDLAENDAAPYFDTFNLHHYEPFSNYPQLYADFRAASGGKPLWVTECSLPVKWNGDPSLEEPTPDDLRLQSERVPKTYALSLHQGARTVFYFILPHFVEGNTQFGIVKRDLSPRPAYLSLAAVGRLLADARPLGQLPLDGAQGYAFRAKPDGKDSVVLVL